MATVLEQIKKLDEQKAALLSQAKQEALEAATKAIASLNELGFNYRLVQGEGSATVSRAATGTRRTGIREQVLAIIEETADGVSRSQLLEMMDAKGDKKAEQSISNALAALKKAGTVSADGGVYKGR